MLRTDNALEYVKNDVSLFCSKNEIFNQISCSHTSQQNSVVERKHRHILDVTRTMMIHMHILKYLRSDAALSACHLINRMPSSVFKSKVLFSCLDLTKIFFPYLLVFSDVRILFRTCLLILINCLLGLQMSLS